MPGIGRESLEITSDWLNMNSHPIICCHLTPLPIHILIHARDVDELDVEHHGGEGGDAGAAGGGGKTLGECERARDIQPADAPAPHGQQTLVQTRDDGARRGVSRDPDVVGLSLLQRVVKDQPLFVLRDVIHDDLETRLRLRSVAHHDVPVLQTRRGGDELGVEERGFARGAAQQLLVGVGLLGEGVGERGGDGDWRKGDGEGCGGGGDALEERVSA
mmetsp:Transcript_3297/g.7710  ORF Transcript_3297/g.7710 Transcript_3297/m.7710 type:complete len:217 (-) Transcript_3297:336-986(-)